MPSRQLTIVLQYKVQDLSEYIAQTLVGDLRTRTQGLYTKLYVYILKFSEKSSTTKQVDLPVLQNDSIVTDDISLWISLFLLTTNTVIMGLGIMGNSWLTIMRSGFIPRGHHKAINKTLITHIY